MTDKLFMDVNNVAGELFCKYDTDIVKVDFADIIYIESMGKNILVHTKVKEYKTTVRLRELENSLPDDMFIRISNSVIIKRNEIKKVTPALGQKFYLTLSNNHKVDVTRTYYYKFKEYFGI